MKAKIITVFFLLSMLFSCSSDNDNFDNNGGGNNINNSVLVKKISTTWDNKYMYSNHNGIAYYSVYADADINTEYTYNSRKLNRIDYNVNFSNYTSYVGNPPTSVHLIWLFTYTGDLITYAKCFENSTQYSEFIFEYDNQKRLINLIKNSSWGSSSSFSFTYNENNKVNIEGQGEPLVIELSYANGIISNRISNLIGNTNINYQYDTKKSAFNNITGYDNAFLGFYLMSFITFEGQGRLFPEWVMHSNTNNLTKRTGSSSVIDVTYTSYNSKNYPTEAIEIDGSAFKESTIEYYE